MFSRKFKLLALAALLLFSALPARAADETAQVMMLREMFRLEQTEWVSFLEKHRGLLDASFFERCEQRIRWALDNHHVEDAFRFSVVADFAAKLTGRPVMYRMELAWAAYRAGNKQFCDDILMHILMTDPGHQDALFLRASRLHDDGSLSQAYEIYKELERQNYKPQDVAYRMGWIESLVGQIPEAIAHLQKATDIPEAVKLLDKINMMDKPTFVPTSASTGNPDADKAFQEAERMLAAGDLTTAESLYVRALTADPKHKNARKYLGALFYRKKDLAKAVEQLSQVTKLDAGDSEAWHFLGNAYERSFDTSGDRGLLEKAVQAYQKASELAPADPAVQSELQRATDKLAGGVSTR